MAAVELDRQAIEKRDFPIGRRGYDTAAVDAHLRALAAEIEELQRARIGSGGESSLAATAGTRVQSILEAAETAAADIEQQALQSASNVREEADRDAKRTREVAVKRAQAHVATVAQATSTLLQRVESMDGEATSLVESLRAGASRLASDLAAVEANMGELYDAASGRAASAADGEPSPATLPVKVGDTTADVPEAQSHPAPAPVAAPPVPANGGSSDLDGARLIALNMALNGESREDADRYLAENFQLADRQKLIEEVYAAIEG
jgi:hypothetical protein